MENRNRQVLLKQRPNGAPTQGDFTITDAPLPDPADGEVLVRGIYLSLDPYMRGRISGQRSYARPVDVGAVMEGRVVGEVARSRDPGFRDGDYVLGGFGWQHYSAVPGQGLLKLDPAEAPLSTALGVLGMPGLTAYVGLDEIGKPQRSETVVVSAARARSGQSSASLPNAPARRSSASPVVPINVAGSRPSSASTLASTTARPTSARRSTARARKGSTSIGKMSAGLCSRRCSRGSTISPAWSCAAWSPSTTMSSRGPAPT